MTSVDFRALALKTSQAHHTAAPLPSIRVVHSTAWPLLRGDWPSAQWPLPWTPRVPTTTFVLSRRASGVLHFTHQQRAPCLSPPQVAHPGTVRRGCTVATMTWTPEHLGTTAPRMPAVACTPVRAPEMLCVPLRPSHSSTHTVRRRRRPCHKHMPDPGSCMVQLDPTPTTLRHGHGHALGDASFDDHSPRWFERERCVPNKVGQAPWLAPPWLCPSTWAPRRGRWCTSRVPGGDARAAGARHHSEVWPGGSTATSSSNAWRRTVGRSRTLAACRAPAVARPRTSW